MLPIKFEGFRLAEKREILFLVFHTNASKFSRERRLGFTGKYMENQNLNIRLFSTFFVRLHFSNLIVKLVSLVCNSWKLQNVNLPQIIEHQSPDFFHTFTVHFALAPAVLHPRQNGVGNLEMVY